MLGTITDDSWSSPAELKRLFSLETPNRSEFCDQVHHLQPKKQICDPEATQPENWDDEDDGEWEVPLIDNPEYEENEGLERSMQRLGAYAITYHELTRQNSIEKRKSSTGFGGKNRNLQQKLNGRRVIGGKKSNQEEKKSSSNGKSNGKSIGKGNGRSKGKSDSGNGNREMDENESKKEEKKSSSHGNVAAMVDVDVDAPEILTKEVHVVEDLVEDVEILNEENVDEIEWIGSEDEQESRPQEVIEIWEEEDNIQGTQSYAVVLLDDEDDEALGEEKEEEYKDDDEEEDQDDDEDEDEDEDDETDIDDYEDFVDAVGRDDQQQMVHERVCDRHWKKFVEIFPNKITCTTCRCHVSQIVLDQYEELLKQAEETENEFGKLHRYNEAILLIDDDPMLHTKMLMLADKLGCT